jgi:hypothetical protein
MGREKVSTRGKDIRSESSEEEEGGNDVHPGRNMEFMCMRRGPDLKLLLPVLTAVIVVMMATLFSRRGPQLLVLEPRGQAPPMKLENVMMTI